MLLIVDTMISEVDLKFICQERHYHSCIVDISIFFQIILYPHCSLCFSLFQLSFLFSLHILIKCHQTFRCNCFLLKFFLLYILNNFISSLFFFAASPSFICFLFVSSYLLYRYQVCRRGCFLFYFYFCSVLVNLIK